MQHFFKQSSRYVMSIVHIYIYIYYQSSCYVIIQVAQICNTFQTIQYGTHLYALKLSNPVVCAKYHAYLWFEHIACLLLHIWTTSVTYLDDWYRIRRWMLNIWTTDTYIGGGCNIFGRLLHMWLVIYLHSHDAISQLIIAHTPVRITNFRCVRATHNRKRTG